MICCVSCLVVLCAVVAIVNWLLRRQRVGSIPGRAIFITGCDTGFGKALAQRLDHLGCEVFAGCLTEQGARELKPGASDRLHTLILDVSNTENIEKAADYVRTQLHGKELWGLVNNAGMSGAGGPTEFLPRDNYTKVLQVNLVGVVEMTRVFLPLLKRSRGRIVNIASITGLLALNQASSSYVCSKFALVGYTDRLRREKAAWGIGVSCVEPGGFRTSIWDVETMLRTCRQQWDSLSPELKQEYGDQYQNKRLEAMPSSVNLASTSLDKVVDAYEHALFAKYPKAHYVVGLDARFLSILSLLPCWMSDPLLQYFNTEPTPNALQTSS